MYNVIIFRNVSDKQCKFTDCFKGFENITVVKKLFGEETEKILSELNVKFFSTGFRYMSVNGRTGNLMINSNYLQKGDERDIYLDIIHELNHVKQFKEGKDIFDERYQYVDRPTEIEAYTTTVLEAKRIGMTDLEIQEYLDTEWLTANDLRKLCRSLSLKYTRY